MSVVLLATLAALAGCSNAVDLEVGGATPTASRVSSDAARTASASEVTELLDRRAAAIVAGDEAGFAATVADPNSTEGRRQLAGYQAARALGVSRLEVAPAVVSRDKAQVEVRYRLGGLDSGDRIARLDYTVSPSSSGWAVVSERPTGGGATAPWVAMPDLRVQRGQHSLVAGTVPAADLAEHAAVVDRAVPGLRREWSGTPGKVLVLAPATTDEADALLGRAVTSGSGAGLAEVAATTEGPTGPDGRATGDRIVLDPSAYARLTPVGRDVVLTHELAHVAVRATVPGAPATWLAEGYADHVGYTRAGLPDEQLLRPLLDEVRAGRGPVELPGNSDLQPTAGDLEVPYLAAWQAVELIADQHGEEVLRRLVAAAASTGTASDAEAATDAALVAVLGTSRSELTRAWQARLRRLAG
ncbi:MAG TPA: hypothetical protein VLA55_09970 [Ornithinibacter sp.]|nr:hypothetical protein [Ornithinibacter sp.]